MIAPSLNDGALVGIFVGDKIGSFVGDLDGTFVGRFDGICVGLIDGYFVGMSVIGLLVGFEDGCAVGLDVGEGDGDTDGFIVIGDAVRNGLHSMVIPLNPDASVK